MVAFAQHKAVKSSLIESDLLPCATRKADALRSVTREPIQDL